ncbi:MAG: cell division protein FtsX [Lentimicrobiaceae bacterium]|jgi:cell division transport system permease protein|nr:cell division protein FtsX [Lentimicrobiaceae bacterium]MCP4910387.1 cell division protein FtsX [Bacteroidota bacterium]MBT3454561.1 cell division protein FtsX [Lentimicrobiaceae bacterium]MBT4061426.1 cell division protein FtsX [Lentimicrobiaceae bacterium]MBT4191196.1 cell division protein FtsX [Lentimicrobiaceae bacterium]
MSPSSNNHYKRRINASYITSVISITLVLFSLGFLGLFVLHAKSLSEYIKENIGFEIIMNKDVKEADIIYLQKQLDLLPSIKSTEYITKEEATARLNNILGEDFTGFLNDDDNPLLPSIDVRFNSSWANNDSIIKIETIVLESTAVKEVYYQQSVVNIINKNIRKISLVLLSFSILLLFIAMALINNTIRLSIYSKRFTIRTMQLVGATEGFIIRPFIITGFIQGLISAIIAMAVLHLMVMAAHQNIPELIILTSKRMLIYLNAGIIMGGLIITGFSTLFAVDKYLHMKTDSMYG